MIGLSEYLLEMREICKSFPGVRALTGASLSLKAGEVMALVGENGAGKSTLINILGGIYSKDSGEILIGGEPVEISGVLAARQLGVSIIHQELVLVPSLSVAENIFINREPVSAGFVSFEEMRRRAQESIDDLGLDLCADDKVSSLTVAQQQMVEIVKAVSFDARIIVMDEPTSSLSEREIEALFESVRRLKSRGIGIIYISHRLSELDEIADRMTVFRDGRTVEVYRVGEVSRDELVHAMVGREVVNYYTKTSAPRERVLLEAKGLTSSSVKDVSFKLHEGEILGFSGLVGAGRTEVVKALLGFDAIESGEVIVDGKPVRFRRPADAYECGFGYIPESRREEALFSLMSTRFNLTIRVLGEFIRGAFVDATKEESITARYINELHVKTPSSDALIQNLSGGNQQKVVIARWLAAGPRVLIMDEPTRGIDVGAKAEIYELMNQLAEQGMGIIMISSELPEILNMSDRVVVMREGRVTATLSGRAEITQDTIMQYATREED